MTDLNTKKLKAYLLDDMGVFSDKNTSVIINSMTPKQSEGGYVGLQICYNFTESSFGTVMIATTEQGLCSLAFEDNEQQGLKKLQAKFPNATLRKDKNSCKNLIARIFQKEKPDSRTIKLHLSASLFQIKVWNALLKIPHGKLSTYGQIAESIGQPKTSRAVGTAIGRNPIAFIIPCHRVIRKTGEIGGYMWGIKRKQEIIAWETEKQKAS